MIEGSEVQASLLFFTGMKAGRGLPVFFGGY